MTDLEQFHDLARSVKKGDYPEGRTLHFLVPRYDWDFSPMPYDLPPSPVLRDDWLRASVRYEAMWACGVGIALTQLAVASYEIESSVPRRASYALDLLAHADSGHPGGGGWVPFMQRCGRDYLTTNNGVFIEIERYTKARGSKIKAIHHLDSARCRRTGDAETPIIYMSRDGREHEMKYWQVISFADMSDPDADKLGQGMCAAHRAWHSICLLASIERYVFEKVSGRRPLKIYLVGGMAPKQLEDMQKEGQIQADQKGTMVYMGAVVSGVPTTEGLTLVEIPLAEIPEGFEAQQERQEASILYADALGIDPQDLRPLTGQALGTGAQSIVLDDKAKGKGIHAFKKHLAHMLNEIVLDPETTLTFVEADFRDKKAQADIDSVLVATGNTLIQSGTITPLQNLQVMVDSGVLPKEFLPVDQTSNVNLGDDEKPEVGAQAGQAGMPNVAPAPILDANGMPTTAQPAGAQMPVALNGAQVTAALGIVSQVAAGNIPRETGINSLITFFALTQQQAERVMGSAGQGFTPDAEAPPVKMPASGGGNDSVTPDDEEEEQSPKKRTKATETVTPRGSTLPPVPAADAIAATLPRLEERAKAVWDATMEQVAGLLDAD